MSKKIVVIGTRLTECPKCKDELDTLPDDHDGTRVKECINCDLIFKKKQGPYFKWRMGSYDAFLDEELKH